jgi:hypothetical protein
VVSELRESACRNHAETGISFFTRSIFRSPVSLEHPLDQEVALFAAFIENLPINGKLRGICPKLLRDITTPTPIDIRTNKYNILIIIYLNDMARKLLYYRPQPLRLVC